MTRYTLRIHNVIMLPMIKRGVISAMYFPHLNRVEYKTCAPTSS
jgi:hypothetical protein